MRLLLEINEFLHVKYLEHHLVHSKGQCKIAFKVWVVKLEAMHYTISGTSNPQIMMRMVSSGIIQCGSPGFNQNFKNVSQRKKVQTDQRCIGSCVCKNNLNKWTETFKCLLKKRCLNKLCSIQRNAYSAAVIKECRKICTNILYIL